MSDSDFQHFIDELVANANPGKLPPVQSWNPPLSGKMDLHIDCNGTWYHQGTAFTRPALVKLLSSILKREGDDYFLVSPVEKWQIQVEDAPLLVTRCDVVIREGRQALVFTTATDDTVVADSDHPIRVEIDNHSGEPSPYIEIRDGLEARINRPVYYQLADIAEVEDSDGISNHVVKSMGHSFVLG